MSNGTGTSLHMNGLTDKTREEQKPGTGPKSPLSTAQGVQSDDITKQTW